MDDQTRELSATVVKTDEVIGVDVKNLQHENLGEIEEIVLDKTKGIVRYVVLSFGGFLGLGDKYFALPWNAIHYDENEECFILNIDKERLKNAPSFDKNNWPDMSDRQFAEKIYTYYGSRADWV
jgi:hypothetical protein